MKLGTFLLGSLLLMAGGSPTSAQIVPNFVGVWGGTVTYSGSTCGDPNNPVSTGYMVLKITSQQNTPYSTPQNPSIWVAGQLTSQNLPVYASGCAAGPLQNPLWPLDSNSCNGANCDSGAFAYLFGGIGQWDFELEASSPDGNSALEFSAYFGDGGFGGNCGYFFSGFTYQAVNCSFTLEPMDQTLNETPKFFIKIPGSAMGVRG